MDFGEKIESTQIAFCHQTNVAVGQMVGRFCQPWPNVGHWSHHQQILPMLGQQWPANHNSGYISLYFADVGPTVDFYSRWRGAVMGDFVKLSKKLFIMVCLKIIFQ